MCDYQYCCMDGNYSMHVRKELFAILERSRKITRKTFLKYANREQLDNIAQALGYEKDARNGLTLKGDWHVGYYSFRLPNGRRGVYMDHSAIEYVFY